jgi:polyphosphate kinase 2 (PPK2 family)
MALKPAAGNKPKMKRKAYEKELRKLQVELCHLQDWVKAKGARIIVVAPMDIESYRRWYDYSRARDMMLDATDSKHAPWHIVRSDDKRRVRLNCIAHILRLVSYKKVPHTKVKLPKRSGKGRYDDQSTLKGRNFVRETS